MWPIHPALWIEEQITFSVLPQVHVPFSSGVAIAQVRQFISGSSFPEQTFLCGQYRHKKLSVSSLILNDGFSENMIRLAFDISLSATSRL
jgi:hypothetical protein